MGKAGDVMRIKLRNDTSVNHTANLHVIFDILKQHSQCHVPMVDGAPALNTAVSSVPSPAQLLLVLTMTV